jgi:class 3 adenylate cyclase/tetratricopeptide (TPR) repeat protein
MFLDLSGFSKMTDTLMQHGQHGAEVLAGLMHNVFDPLVESIFEYGGKIVGFAGDGIMALYPVETDERTTAHCALASAYVIQRRLESEPVRSTVYGRFPVTAKIGLANGSVLWRILRSGDDRQATYYFRGSAVEDSAAAEHQAGARNIVLMPEMKELLNNEIATEFHGGLYRFTGFRSGIPQPASYSFSPIDLNISRCFMPEDVIVHDVRSEFRQIVNLFIRIPELSDEKLADFINAVFKLRNQYGGLLTRLDFGDKGCNMLILWGAPVAYENDIGRALNFVLDLQARTDFPITAGVTYYIAHAGYLGSAMCEDYTCYGWGVNLASRFMTSAPPGAIWVDDRVARRVSQRFSVEYLGSQSFKGFAEEQKVYLLTDRKSNFDMLYQGEMVGREAELKRLEEFVAPLWDGKFAGVLSVTGDAGIGKGRLVHAFRSSNLFGAHDALWATCQTDQILMASFNPFRKWLFRYFGISPDQTTEERRHALDSKLDELIASMPDLELASELTRTRSILASLVDVTWEDSLYSQLDAEGRYNNIFLALIALVKAESVRQPVILFVDDVHFIDPDSKLFLSRLKRSLSAEPESHPVAILLLYRKEGTDRLMQDDLSDSEIELRGISGPELSRLAETLLGGAASPGLLKLVLSRSEGNPYFAEQVIRYLQEEHLLEMGSDGWRQVHRTHSSLLPGDIRALLVARLDQLKLEVKSIVQTASVLGREFEVRILTQMLGNETDTLLYVSEAEKAAIWASLQEIRYIFHHGLLRDAAYTMQMRARRKELHILALNALETMYGDDPGNRSAEFAFHAEQGELSSKACHYYTQAGKISSESYQNEQAVIFLNRAIAYAPLDDLAMQFNLVAERVEVYSRMGKRELQSKDLNSLEQWASALGDALRVLKTLRLQAVYHYLVGDYVKSLEYAQQTEVLAGKYPDSKDTLNAQLMWALSLQRLGRLDEAMRRAEAVLSLVAMVNDRRERGRILTVMGLIALEQKEPANAFKFLVEALEIARELKDRTLESRALNNLALADGSVGGNYALARTRYEEVYKISREIGDRNAEGFALGNLGFAAGMQGDFDASRSYHEQSLRVSLEIGNLYFEIYTLINLSAVLGIQNESGLALQYAQRAVELSQKSFERAGEAWAWLYLGHAHSLQDELQQARAAYRKSIEIRDELGQPGLSMEPIAGIIETYLKSGDLEAASVETEKILKFFDSGSNLGGTDEPLRVYYACYRVLKQKQDPRAQTILQEAKNQLEAQVLNFSDDLARERYIENIPWRRAIRDAV